MIEMSKDDYEKVYSKYLKARKNKHSHTYFHQQGERILIVINDLYQEWRIFERLGRTIYALEVDRKAG